jgi:hypothetical protein
MESLMPSRRANLVLGKSQWLILGLSVEALGFHSRLGTRSLDGRNLAIIFRKAAKVKWESDIPITNSTLILVVGRQAADHICLRTEPT